MSVGLQSAFGPKLLPPVGNSPIFLFFIIWRCRTAEEKFQAKRRHRSAGEWINDRRRNRAPKCGKKSIKHTVQSEECVCLGGNMSIFAAGEKRGGRWPGISIHLAQEPSPPKRKLTPAGEQRRAGWREEGSLERITFFCFCVAFKCPLPFQTHFLVH